MVVVTVSTRHFETMKAVLVYGSHVMKETQKDHALYLCGFKDKSDNLISENHPEKIVEPVFCLSPSGAVYEIPWKDKVLSVTCVQQDTQLYKCPDMSHVSEHVYEVHIEAENRALIDDFMMEALRYVAKWETYKKSASEISVYHWNDEYWDILNTMEKRDESTIYLPNNETQRMIRDVQDFLSPEKKALYNQFGVPYHRTYCLHGPPGTGKSSLIFAVVSSVGKDIGVLSLSKKTDDQSFIHALNSIPKNTILLLEDIDCLLGERSDKQSQITFSTLLNCLDGVQSKQGLVTFITTNYFLKLDPAFCRPGRIDYVLEFTYATKSQIYTMLNKFFPEQSHNYDAFYQQVRSLKVSTCILQKYFFECYSDQDILTRIDNLKKDIQLCVFEKDDKMYM